MTTNARTKLRKAIEQLTDEQALDLLDYINLQRDPDSLTEAEKAAVMRGEEELARGESVTPEEFRKKREA